MPRTKRRKNVALLIEMSNRYGRELLHGIHSYVREQASWSIQLTEQGRGYFPRRWLQNWKGDGIIARIESPEIAEAVQNCGVPAVNVSATSLAPDLVSVVTDSVGAARLAAEHLLERGLVHFGFCGDARFEFSGNHSRNFVDHLQAAGHSCSLFPTTPKLAENWERERQTLAAWIRGLPKPVGIMACYDIRGQQLLEVCRHIHAAVPEQVAVIGLHNDELLCDLCEPPLSSVIPNPRRTGYEAALVLDHLMRGRKVPPGVRTVPPLGVATRQSTDIIAVENEHIAAALRFIRNHACDGITVGSLLKEVPISRTALERGFRKLLAQTPHEQILRTKLARTKQMLTETDLPLETIAQRTGFRHAEYLSVAFKKHTGLNPSAYRNAARL